MQKRTGIARGLWAAGGIVAFGLGAFGSVLPILPTTPFMLVAAFCFARSSERLDNWFKQTSLYKKVFEGLVTKRQMTVKAKLSILVPVTILMAIGFALMGRVPVGRIVLAVVWVAHVVYFGFIVKTDRGDSAETSAEDGSCPEDVKKPRHSKMPLFKGELLDLLADSKKYVWMQVAWKLLALASQIAIVLSAAQLVQRAYDSTLEPTALAIAAAIIVVGIVARVIADRGESHTAYLASVDVKRVLRGKIYDKLLRLGASYRESVATSKVVQLAVEGVEQLETYFSLFLSQLVYALVAPVVLFFVVGPLYSWKAAAILLVFVPLIPVSIAVVQTVAKRLLSKYWGTYTQLGDTFLENLQGLTTLKIYKADEQAAQQMDRDSEKFRVVTMNVLKMQLNSTTVMDIGAYGGAAAGMIMALVELAAGNIAIGGAFAIFLLAAEFFLPMRRLGSYFHVGMNGMAASDNIFELLDLPEPASGGKVTIDERDISIRFDDVSFSYDGQRSVLDQVSLEARPGQLVSIVGPSGCGKSTIANLIMGKNRAYEGSIALNGVQVREIEERSLMDHVTLVSRASHIFKGSVRDNLVLACPNADDAKLLGALDKVRIADFVRAQGGLDMPLEEGGSNLSGGQRQRLLLARALLHDTPAYLFDEATSSIDAESEELIMDVVRELAQTRTVVLISHRLANVVSSDAICMMQEGRVIESGTHDELMAAAGPYARLFAKQCELESFATQAKGARAKASSETATASTEPMANMWCKQNASGIAEGASPASAPGDVAGPERRNHDKQHRSALSIMRRLIVLVGPMVPIMCLAIVLGTIGFACAIFLTVLAGAGATSYLGASASDFAAALASSPPALFGLLVGMAVARGLLHYGEQYCNHYIAFKILALVRNKVFAKLRVLAPAKLEVRDKGDLISLITGDVELLEVFYAHTISPIAIATLVSILMVAFLGAQHWAAGALACAAYVLAGVALPVWNGKRASALGTQQRGEIAELNSYVLDSLYGLDETIQYDDGRARADCIDGRSRGLSELGGQLNRVQRSQIAATDVIVQLFSWGMLFMMLGLWTAGAIGFGSVVVATLAMVGSFGPVIALSNLSTTLSATLASGQRVLDLLEEQPETAEISGWPAAPFGDVALRDVTFSYDEEQVLSDFSLHVPAGTVVGIHGPSGSGKSTICKLIMRFWDVDAGGVHIDQRDVRSINTTDLRDMESYVTQDTWLFHRSIADNIAVGNLSATREEIAEAARKAALDTFLESLPQGIDTMVGELGDTLSDGERQRIGLARAFLHDAPLMLLDEPTSNLDSLNEAVILRSLAQMGNDKTVVLVSHRASTMALADQIVEVEGFRAS